MVEREIKLPPVLMTPGCSDDDKKESLFSKFDKAANANKEENRKYTIFIPIPLTKEEWMMIPLEQNKLNHNKSGRVLLTKIGSKNLFKLNWNLKRS